MNTEHDRQTLRATLCEIGWPQPDGLAADVHVVELDPPAPPVRDVIVTLDAAASRLVVRVRFLPPRRLRGLMD